MKKCKLNILRQVRAYQNGAAVLATAVILLLGGTILAFVSAQLVLDQTKITSNDYRTYQATEAALAGIDEGMAYFNMNSTTIDTTSIAPSATQLTALENSCSFTSGATNATELSSSNAIYYYANSGIEDRCGADGATNAATLYSIGWSDDCTAKRTISVCLGTVPLIEEGGGPKQPFVTRAGVGALGNASIVNRYTNISVWAGDEAAVSGNAFDTWLRPSGSSEEDYNPEDLYNEDPNVYSEKVSDASSGFGVDIVLGDKTLANASDDEFWATFFSGITREDFKTSLDGRTAPIPYDLDNYDKNSMTGQFWTDGDYEFSGNDQYGSPTEPVMLFIDGDLRISGSPKFYGILFVTGELDLVGNMSVIGSVISENGPNTGTGTMQIIYKPWGSDTDDDIDVSESGVVIPGSWKDW